MDPELTRKGSEFFLGIAKWINELLDDGTEEVKPFTEHHCADYTIQSVHISTIITVFYYFKV